MRACNNNSSPRDESDDDYNIVSPPPLTAVAHRLPACLPNPSSHFIEHPACVYMLVRRPRDMHGAPQECEQG